MRLLKALYEIYAKATGHSVERIEQDCDRDNFMSPDEAKAYGLVDQVMDKKLPVHADKK
jgi:ATP-dependent Clp protease, protease subunit